MSSKTVLHIGLPKTGTTSLQVQLRDREDINYVYTPGSDQPQSRAFSNSIGVGQDIISSPQACAQYHDALVRQINSSPFPVSFLSDETLSQIQRIDWDVLEAVLSRISGDIQVVMVIRPFLGWVESLINQFVKRANFNFQAFRPGRTEIVNAYTLNILKIHERYSQLVKALGPRAELIVLKYHPKINEEIMAMVGLVDKTGDGTQATANRSPNAFAALSTYAQVINYDDHRLPPATDLSFIGKSEAQLLLKKNLGWITELSEKLGWDKNFINDSDTFSAAPIGQSYLEFGRKNLFHPHMNVEKSTRSSPSLTDSPTAFSATEHKT